MVACVFTLALNVSLAPGVLELGRFDDFMVPTITSLPNLTLPLGSAAAPFHSAVCEYGSAGCFPFPHTHAFTCRAPAPGVGAGWGMSPHGGARILTLSFFLPLLKRVSMQENVITLNSLPLMSLT